MNFDEATLQHIVTSLSEYGLSVIGAVITLIVGWSLAKWAEGMTRRGLERTKRIDLTLTSFFSILVRYLVLIFTLIAVLNQFGVQTTSLIAVLGAAGLAIGLAMQGTLSNIAAGVMLLIFRPFKIGDYVEASGQSGTVSAIGLFVTELTTPDNKQIIVPNNNVWGQAITNYSYHATRRLDLEIGISYGDDIDQAFRIVREMVDAESRIMNDPEPMIAVANLAESSVDLTIRVWVDAADYWPLKFDLTKRLKQAFDNKGLAIPFPQMDVHVHREPEAPREAQSERVTT